MGTCGHQMLEDLLNNPALDLQTYLGREFFFAGNGGGWADEVKISDPDHIVEVTQELIDAVLTAHRFVVEQAALIGGEVRAEMRVPIDHITGEEDAKGTSDVIITAGDLVWVCDLKLGRKRVTAYDVITPAGTDIITGEPTPEVVRPNLQMSMYALGTMKAYAPRKFTQVRLTILQPFLNSVSEWSGTVEEVEEVGRWLSDKAAETRSNPTFVPSAENCHFCRASGNCQAQTEFVLKTTLDGFEDAEPVVREPKSVDLGQAYAVVPLVKKWCEAVEARVRQALEDGEPVVRADGIGYKLVAGRKGDRKWVDEGEVEAYLKTMRIGEDNIYRRRLISPSDAEKLAKAPKVKKGEEAKPPLIGATRWKRLQELITQSEGAPAIAIETDPRPALPSKTAGFDDVPPADNSDLF